MSKITMIKCDRCGHIFDPNTTTLVSKKIPMLDPNESKEMDFCTECTKSFDSMIREAISQWLSGPTLVVETPEQPKPETKSVEDISTESCYNAYKAAKSYKSCWLCPTWSSCQAHLDQEFKDGVNYIRRHQNDKVEVPEKKETVVPHTKDHGGDHYTWTTKEIDFLYKNKSKGSAWIAEQLGRSRGSVSGKMSSLKLLKPIEKRGHRYPLEKWQIDYIIQNYNLMSQRKLVEALGGEVSQTAISRKIRELKANGQIP